MRETALARQPSAANDDGSFQGCASPRGDGRPDREDPKLFGLIWVDTEIAYDATIIGLDRGIPRLTIVF